MEEVDPWPGLLLSQTFGCLRFNTTETSGPGESPKGKRQNEPTSGPQQAPPRGKSRSCAASRPSGCGRPEDS